MRFMETGKWELCPCSKKDKCSTYGPILAIACKTAELCVFGLGLGYNVGLGHFGVSEGIQRTIVNGTGYFYDPVSGFYLLSDDAKKLLKGSKLQCPAVIPCVFDCLRMPN